MNIQRNDKICLFVPWVKQREAIVEKWLNYVGRRMEDKNYFNECLLVQNSFDLSFSLMITMLLSFWYREDIFHFLLFKKRRKSKCFFLVFAVFQVLQTLCQSSIPWGVCPELVHQHFPTVLRGKNYLRVRKQWLPPYIRLEEIIRGRIQASKISIQCSFVVLVTAAHFPFMSGQRKGGTPKHERDVILELEGTESTLWVFGLSSHYQWHLWGDCEQEKDRLEFQGVSTGAKCPPPMAMVFFHIHMLDTHTTKGSVLRHGLDRNHPRLPGRYLRVQRNKRLGWTKQV